MVVIMIVAPSTVIASIVMLAHLLEISSSGKILSYILKALRLIVLFVFAIFLGVFTGAHGTVNLPLTVL